MDTTSALNLFIQLALTPIESKQFPTGYGQEEWETHFANTSNEEVWSIVYNYLLGLDSPHIVNVEGSSSNYLLSPISDPNNEQKAIKVEVQ